MIWSLIPSITACKNLLVSNNFAISFSGICSTSILSPFHPPSLDGLWLIEEGIEGRVNCVYVFKLSTIVEALIINLSESEGVARWV
jgi:hypothetical protein